MNDPIGQAAVLKSRAFDKYYEWVRLMLSLATASLMGLIALQDNYVPNSPNALYLLWASWISLAGSVLAAAIVLRGEGLSLSYLSRSIAREVEQRLEERIRIGKLPLGCELAARSLPWLLAVSLVLLCSFAICNSAVPSTTKQRDGMASVSVTIVGGKFR